MATVLSSFRYADSLVVMGISVCTTFLCKGISWLLIYRTSTTEEVAIVCLLPPVLSSLISASRARTNPGTTTSLPHPKSPIWPLDAFQLTPDHLPAVPVGELRVSQDGLDFWQFMVVSSVASVVEYTAIFPVDTLKT